MSFQRFHRDILFVAATIASAITACMPPAPDAIEERVQSIIGGGPSSATDFPTAGVLLLRASFGSMTFAQPLCTGTLVAPDTVMTAGHCVEDFGLPPGALEYFFTFDLDVSGFGVNTTDPPVGAKIVRKLVGHPNFDINSDPGVGLGQWFDVGVVFLGDPVTTVTPEIVADAQDGMALAVSAQVDIAGYGQTDPNSDMIGIKNHAPSIINEVGDWEMQIGDVAPIAQKCHGDSGGPTYMRFSDGRLPEQRVIGITSRAYDDSDCARGGVDSRADAYRSWFEGEMVAACNDGTRGMAECANGGGLPLPGMGVPADAGISDTGVPPDSGVIEPPDSGVIEEPDTGIVEAQDSGVVEAQDSGVVETQDGGVAPQADAGGSVIIGGRDDDEGGCDCTATPRSGSSSTFGLLAMALIFALTRRAGACSRRPRR